MNEFEYKTYKKEEKNYELINAAWVYPFEDEQFRSFIVFYKHSDLIWPVAIMTDVPQETINGYENIINSIENDVRNEMEINDDRLNRRITSEEESQYITEEVDMIIYNTINLLNQAGYFRNGKEKCLHKYNSASFEVKVGQRGIDVYRKVLRKCSLRQNEIEEYIKNMPFKTPKGWINESF